MHGQLSISPNAQGHYGRSVALDDIVLINPVFLHHSAGTLGGRRETTGTEHGTTGCQVARRGEVADVPPHLSTQLLTL